MATRSHAEEGKHDDVALTSARKTETGDRMALLDITNDSPIAGLAGGVLAAKERTPISSSWAKGRPARTPCSGEALLRGQVKTLLQKVEEEDGAAVTKPPVAGVLPPFRAMLAATRSPAQLLAPTPANTPQLPGAPGAYEICSTECQTVASRFLDSERDLHLPKQAVVLGEELLPCVINRALYFDSPDKLASSDMSAGSTVSVTSVVLEESEGSSTAKSSLGYVSSSGWSMQVNVSSEKNTEKEEEDEEDGDGVADKGELSSDCDEYYSKEEEGDDESYDDLCVDMSKMSVATPLFPQPQGRHTRFIYNSDGEMEGEEVESATC